MPVVNSKRREVDFYNKNEVDIYNKWANLYSYKDWIDNYHNYFDYYFSGQDIQIRIEGLDGPRDFLPIYNFGFNIQQNKQPVYGYWSYTYDYMLRGTRIVTGAFTVVTRSPGFMTEMVAKAAENRMKTLNNKTGGYSTSLHPIRGLDTDERNIDTYWRRNFDSNLTHNQNHLFSTHPPFNFLVTFGIQDTSVSWIDPSTRADYLRYVYQNSTAMMSDINERIVEADPDKNSMMLLIENVELVTRQMEVNAEGDPIMETYTFMARDIVEAPDYDPKSRARNAGPIKES